MSNFKTVAAFVGGLVLGAGALSVSPPDDEAAPIGVPDGGDHIAPPEGEHPEGMLPPDGGALPPPPEGTPHLPPDGAGVVMPDGVGVAEGQPPLGAVPPGQEQTFSSAGVRAPPVAGVLLLDEHLSKAESRWWEIRGRVKGVSDSGRLLREIDALVLKIPEADGGMPPLQEVVSFLVAEKLLLIELADAGVDVAAANEQLDKLLNPPRGKVVGGHEKATVPGGAGQAPVGTRPLDPDTPRRVETDG